MSVYILTHDGVLCHAFRDDSYQKEDHKYTKREWKNGRWVYTYDEDTKDTKSSKGVTISPIAKASTSSSLSSARQPTAASKTSSSTTSVRTAMDRGAKALGITTSSKLNTYEKPEGNKSISSKTTSSVKNTIPKQERMSTYDKTPNNTSATKTETKKTTGALKGAVSSVEKMASNSVDAAKKRIDELSNVNVEELKKKYDSTKSKKETKDKTISKDNAKGSSKGNNKTNSKNNSDLEALYAAEDRLNDSTQAVLDEFYDLEALLESKGELTDEVKAQLEAEMNARLVKLCEEYLSTDAEHRLLKSEYDYTTEGKVDKWLDGDEEVTSETSAEAALIKSLLDSNPTLKGEENEYMVNYLSQLLVSNRLSEDGMENDPALTKYLEDLRTRGTELYDAVGKDLSPEERAIELKRMERLMHSLEVMLGRS